jgi:Ser/Thr protein kinase RdoA (MazF antagonist)
MVDRSLVARIEQLTGETVTGCRAVHGGYTPVDRLVCTTRRGSVFVKAGNSVETSRHVRREVGMYQRIHGSFMPRLLAFDDDEPRPILIIEDLSTGHWPPPWTEQHINLVRSAVAELHDSLACVEPYADVHPGRDSNWSIVAADPEPFLSLGLAGKRWLHTALPVLTQYEERCSTRGSSLTHWDIRSDNICIDGTRALLVDWNMACLSNPDLDLGFWLPSLAYESGMKPEEILPDSPEIAAWVAGFFAARAGLPVIPHAPQVRAVQLRQLQTSLAWAARALGLPDPVG